MPLLIPLLHFWALNVVVVLLSMQGQRALGFHQKYLNLCSKHEQKSYGFGTTWGWVINDRIFIFWVNYPFKKFVVTFCADITLKSQKQLLLVCLGKKNNVSIFPSSGRWVEQKRSSEVSAGRSGGLWVVGLSERPCWGGRSEGLLHTHHPVPTQSFSPAQSARQTSRISTTTTHRQVLDLCFISLV